MPDELPRTTEDGHVGPVVASVVPRFAGPATFARLPRELLSAMALTPSTP